MMIFAAWRHADALPMMIFASRQRHDADVYRLRHVMNATMSACVDTQERSKNGTSYNVATPRLMPLPPAHFDAAVDFHCRLIDAITMPCYDFDKRKARFALGARANTDSAAIYFDYLLRTPPLRVSLLMPPFSDARRR